MKIDYFSHAGMRLRYLDSEGDGPPVLCFHGNSSSSNSFTDLFRTLGSRHRLIAVDFPGHGHSAHSMEPSVAYTLTGFSNAVAATVNHFGFASYSVIGHSLGGHAVLEALPRLRSLQALVLVSSPPFNCQSIGKTFLADPSEGRVFQALLSEEDIARLAKTFVNADKLSPTRFMQTAEMIRLTDPQVRKYIGKSLGQGTFGDEYQLLRDSGVPTLMVLGRTDLFINLTYCNNLANFPGSDGMRVSVFDDSGHNPHFEQPEQFAKIVGEFIKTTRRKS